jgi:hypothetical protein
MNKATILEIVLFRTKEGVNSEEFKTEMKKFNDFLVKQKGFISRNISIADDGQYCDMVYWTDLDAAKTAFDKANEAPGFEKLLSMMNLEAEFFKYFEIFSDTTQSN